MPSTLKLTNRQILNLRDGFKSLDGVPGRPGEVIRFEFDAGLSWNITKNTVIIERAVEVYERQRAKITKESGVAAGTTVTDANAEKVSAWKEKLDALKNDATQELVGLLKIQRAELQKAGVKFPGILANLFPLLESE